MNSDHLIIVEKPNDFRWSDPGMEVVTAENFLADGPRIRSRPRKIINLCRSYSYLSVGYYCSLLAEARGDRVTPSVETILDLGRRKQQASMLPMLNSLVGPLKEVPRSVRSLTLHVFFGEIEDPQLANLARKSFEMFQCPLLEIEVERAAKSEVWEVAALQPLNRLLKYSRASEPAQRRQAHFSQQLSVCWKSARKPACFQPYSTVF